MAFRLDQSLTTSLEYNITVDPSLPVVNVGTREKPVYLPTDVCEVEAGQPVKNKLSPRQTQNMLNFAVKDRMPAQNAQSIVTKGVGVLGIGQPLNSTLVSE
jgi:eukaryotic translation initiation factor 2C